MRRSLSRLSLIALLLFAVECRSATKDVSAPTPAPVLAERPRDAVLVSLVSRLPADYSAVVALYPSRVADAEATVRTLLDGLPLGSGPMLRNYVFGFAQGALGLTVELFALADALDPSRPVVAGLLAVPGAAPFDAIAYGNIPDLEEGPPFLLSTVLLPAKDPAEALRLLAPMAERARLRGPEKPEPGKVAVYESPELLVALSTLEGVVRVDVATSLAGPPDVRRKAFEARVALPGAKPPRSPATIHFLEGQGVLTGRVDLGRLMALGAALGINETREAMDVVSPEYRQAMLAKAVSIVLSAASLMSPSDRMAKDLAFSVDLGTSLDVRITRTLMPAAQKVYAEAASSRGVTARASGDPLLTLRYDRSLRTLVEKMPRPAWATGGEGMSTDEVARSLAEGGVIMGFYTLVAAPWTAPGLLLDAADKGSPLRQLPDAFSLQISHIGGGALAGRLVADLPGGAATAWKKLAPSVVGDALRRVGLSGAIAVSVSERGGRSAVTVAVGEPAEAPAGDAARNAEAGVEVHVDLARLLKELPLPTPLPGVGTLDVVDRIDGACQATRLRVLPAKGAASAGALEPVITARDPGPLPAPDSAGKLCLRRVPWIVGRAFEGLAMVSPDKRVEFLGAADSQLAPSFACARKDSGASALADQAEAGWSLFVARFIEQTGEREQAVPWAERACKLGRELGCVLAKAAKPPYPQGTLVLPKLAWPSAGSSEPPAVRVERSNEGIYVDGKRLQADLGEPGAGMLVPALHESLKRARTESLARALRDGAEPGPLRVGLWVDGRTPYRELARLLYTVSQAEGTATLALSGRDGSKRWLTPTFPKMRAARATPRSRALPPTLLHSLGEGKSQGLEGAFDSLGAPKAEEDPEQAARRQEIRRKIREQTTLGIFSEGGPTPPPAADEDAGSDGGENPLLKSGILRAIELDEGHSRISIVVKPDELLVRIVGRDDDVLRIPRAAGTQGQELVAFARAVQDMDRKLDRRPLATVAADPTIRWADLAELLSVLAVPPDARYTTVDELRTVIEGRVGSTTLPDVVLAVTE